MLVFGMKTVCAWCGKIVHDGTGPVSHSICATCFSDPLIQEGVSIQTFIDRYPFPVLAVNSSLDPISINNSARDTLGKNLETVSGYTVGAIVDCDDAKLPGGCGHAVHCLGCAIRRAISETNRTGQPSVDVPARFTVTRQEICYQVSTLKVDDCVIVKLDRKS